MIRKISLSNSKRGNNGVKVLVGAILAIIFLIFFISQLIKHSKPLDQLKNYTECTSNSLNMKGVCKEKCSPSEMRFNGLGCPPKDNKQAVFCCIDPNNQDETQSDNPDYKFTVFNIGIDQSQLRGKCKETDKYTYTCNNPKDITVKMDVTNKGKYDMDIFANPKVGETYPVQGRPVTVKPGETKMLTVNLQLERTKSYIVKGAAKCNTGVCKTVFGDTGVFSINEEQYITIITN
ncbi:MAG: hypothetical protein KatS3mg002_0486 [Candidatus Woesearchaeota archaeon]|nr:MAG: hypothetical protein KatS3mg002_0486 [Candidatus Woesearchaeota archaeon]